MFKYSIIIQWSDEDKAYVAVVPELPGLSALGSTPEKASKELLVAGKLYIDALAQKGNLPEPDKLKQFSGQIRVRFPKSLHAVLSYEAEKDGVSLNTFIIHLLTERNIVNQLKREIEELRAELKAKQDTPAKSQASGSSILVAAMGPQKPVSEGKFYNNKLN